MVTPNRPRPKPQLGVAATLVCMSLLIGGCTLTENPYESQTVKGDEAVALIDSMRPEGSYEDARQRMNDAAAAIADRIVAAVPGQTWRVSDDPHGLEAKRAGLPCEKLTGDIARRPLSDPIIFGRTFDAEEFAVAGDIVGREAARFGATDQSSLFNEQAKRDYNVQGNGYEFSLGQINNATLNITGDCFLMQSVVDLPPGQLPPEPPIVAPTTPS